MKILNLISRPVYSLRGEVCVPGDKSISHRAIIFGSLAKGTTIIDGFLDGDDCMATLRAFQAMGVTIDGPDEEQVIIYGEGKHSLKKPTQAIDCANSGTTMRLLAGILAAQNFDSQLTGDASLLKRPMSRISNPLTLMGANISTENGHPPLIIKGGKKLKGIDYLMPEASAQVKSCLLLAGIYAEGETCITETKPCRNHTEMMLESFSYPLKRQDHTVTINAKGEFIATEIVIPGDISSAAFFIVAATIIPNSDIIIRNVGINPTRTGIIHILLEMGADIILLNQRQQGEEWVADLQVKYAPLNSIQIAPELVPLAIDEFPVIFIAAACAQGQTILHGAKELRFKESDRISTMVNGLQKLGIKAQSFDDGVSIEGGTIQGGLVDSLGDHRVAMAFAIAGSIARDAVTIKNCTNITTSFPSFIATAKELGLNIGF